MFLASKSAFPKSQGFGSESAISKPKSDSSGHIQHTRQADQRKTQITSRPESSPESRLQSSGTTVVAHRRSRRKLRSEVPYDPEVWPRTPGQQDADAGVGPSVSMGSQVPTIAGTSADTYGPGQMQGPPLGCSRVRSLPLFSKCDLESLIPYKGRHR